MGSKMRRFAPWLQVVAAAGAIAGVIYLALTKSPDDWLRWVVALGVITVVSVSLLVLSFIKYINAKKEGHTTFQIWKSSSEKESQIQAHIQTLTNNVAYLESLIDINKKSEFSHLEILKQILSRDFQFCELMHWSGEGFSKGRVEDLSNAYIRDILGLVAKLFTIYTNHPSSACIKYFSIEMDEEEDDNGEERFRLTGLEPGPNYITTLCRDIGSEQRGQLVRGIDEPYSYTANTAFLEIVQHRTRYDGYFFGNMLTDDSSYQNGNSNWSEHYDSTAVCALQDPSRLKLNNLIGFLCVDNRGGGFDDKACRALLECCSSILYYSLQTVLSVYYPKVVIEGD